ncbi:uncharacterized protein FTJAE_3066 [Fusarium tjaetaba]|uniref:Uncharacterized protein n=1 Tax=Fusarium tjaetaba TaxID=1567544 RepID=A0A8H5S1J3_9HYPO|nr:uncharacterized protein FTJAE_3066 [Fusarium tjaetaba]KAF5643767.1 hypothetical protein FTJAE_3066 [Fusarium tjaetaba]
MSWSNSQEFLDTIEESMAEVKAEFKAVRSELDQARTAALQAKDEREHYETSFNNLEKEYKVLKEESEKKDKQIEELKQALKHYEDRFFPNERRSWRDLYKGQ